MKRERKSKKPQKNITKNSKLSINKKRHFISIKEIIEKEGIFNIVVLFLSTFLFLFFSLSHLGKHVYTDEPVLWYPWIEQFGHALKNFDFSEINKPYNYPGMPVIALGSLLTAGKSFTAIPAEEFHNYLFLMKSPIVIFNFLTLIIIYIFSKRLWNKETALLITLLLSLHPLIIAFSQHTQGDTTLWNTFFLSILSFFLYIKKGGKKYIFLTALFFSLAALSKFFGMILYPLLFIFLYSEYIFSNISRKQFIEKIKGLLFIYVLLLLFIFILYPPAWHNPYLAIETSFLHYSINIINPFFPILSVILIAEVFINGRVSELLKRIKLKKILFISFIIIFFTIIIFGILSKFSFISLGKGQIYFGGVHVKDFLTSIDQFSRTLNALIPWYVFAGIIAIIIKQIFYKTKNTNRHFVIYALFTIFAFAIAAMLGTYQIWVKYILFLTPLIYAGFALLFVNNFKKNKFLIVLIGFIAVSEVISVYPTYFSYRNTFIPLQNQNIYDGNYGGFEIAEKANKLENVENIRVLSDTYGFGFYFKGINRIIQENISEEYLKQFDYAYLTSFGKKEKSAWGMLPYSLRLLYELPDDSVLFKLGNSDTYAKFIKIPEYKHKYVPKNSFDTDFYLNMNKNNSICFWFLSVGDSTEQLISLSRTKKDQIKFIINNNRIITKYSDSIVLKNKFNKEKWQHIAWVNKANKMNDLSNQVLYVNGKKVDQKEITLYGKKIKGLFFHKTETSIIDDIRIYKQALNESQVAVIYNEGEINKEEKLTSENKEFSPARHYTLNK